MTYFIYYLHMKLQHNADGRFWLRVRALKEYLKSGSIEKVAFSYNVHPITLRRWVKRYQKGGEEDLKRKRTYTRHPKRFTPSIEKKIVLLKENKPSLTTVEAQNMLANDGVKASIRGIWGVWKRYNLVGFYRHISNPTAKVKMSTEVEDCLKKAEQALNNGEVKKAARILNALPSCRGKAILAKIPDRLLSLSRQVDKLPLIFGREPLEETVRKARALRHRAEKRRLLYTSVRAGIAELFGALWRVKPDEQLLLIHKLQNRVKRKNKGRSSTDPVMYFNLLFIKAMVFADIGKTKEAISCIRECEIICRRHSLYSNFHHKIASLYSIIGFRKKSRAWLKKGLVCSQKSNKGIFYEYLASNFTGAGQYKLAKRTLKKVPIEEPPYRSLAAIIQAQCALGRAEIQDATAFANKALFESKKERIHVYFSEASLILACCSCALGEVAKAEALLKRVVVVLEKFRMKRSLTLIQILLGRNVFPRTPVLNHSFKLTLCLSQASKSLKIKDYRKAFNYATSQQLMGLFHRLVLFFPEPVNKLIAKGKPTGLPKTILKLPVFNKETPVFNVRFFGNLVVYKNQKYLKTHLSPKEKAFLIQLALRAGEPRKGVSLERIYVNFWKRSKNPSRNLSHLLVRVKKVLKIPSHLLEISHRKDNPVLINRGIHFITDYGEYEQSLAQAKALLRAGEWGFAKKEYLRAFRVFRGEPFKKMY